MQKFIQNRRSVWIIAILNALLIALSGGIAWASCSTGEELLEEYWNRFFLTETIALVQIPSYDGEENNHIHLQQAQTLLREWVNRFNEEELKNLKLRHFEWSSVESEEGVPQKTPPPYKVFGFRLGNGPNKVSLLTHVDVVPPGDSNWQPFEPEEKILNYQPSELSKNLKTSESVVPWGDLSFLVGRGTIDDKGPAVSTLIALRTLAKQFDDNPEALKDVTLELLFDTSEETGMSTPHYLEYLKNTGNADKKPDMGIVFDAMWCVRAEKGGEGPTFSLARTDDPTDSELLMLSTLYSGDNGNNAVNQIPDTATAIINKTPNTPSGFCGQLENIYKLQKKECPIWVNRKECPYRPAELECVETDSEVTLTTKVMGSQHGSSPHENRDSGANPLVSLANFLAFLATNKKRLLADNSIARMTQFIRWGWGTQVFGEKHPELLERHDDVFVEGNGTTYAITNFKTEDDKVQFSIDIRYAIQHHADAWDGNSGFLPGKISRFGKQGDTCAEDDCLFDKLVEEFNSTYGGTPVEVNTKTSFVPDIRDTEDPALPYHKINTAFKQITKTDCPKLAIGGGTDAKGHTELWAAGALFDTQMGPPINYHGINEGAPVEHLKLGAKILYRFMCNEIEACD